MEGKEEGRKKGNRRRAGTCAAALVVVGRAPLMGVHLAEAGRSFIVA